MTTTMLISKETVTRRFISAWRLIDVWSDFIFVIFLIFLYFAYDEYSHRSRMQLIKEPKINDFYFVDYKLIEPSADARFRYLPLKVSYIDGEFITFKIGNLGYTKKVSVTEHVKFDMAVKNFYFKKEDLVVSHQTLLNWTDDGIVYDIDRPKNIYINGWIVIHQNDLP